MNDELQLAEFLAKHREKLIDFAQKEVTDAMDAEDAFQHLWVKPRRRAGISRILSDDGEFAALAWCCKAITGEFRDIRRHRFLLERKTRRGQENRANFEPDQEDCDPEARRQSAVDELSRVRMRPTDPRSLEIVADEQNFTAEAGATDWASIKVLVESCVGKLQPAEIPVIRLWMELDCPKAPDEIARLLAKDEGYINTIKCRALPKLKACLKQKGFDSSGDLI